MMKKISFKLMLLLMLVSNIFTSQANQKYDGGGIQFFAGTWNEALNKATFEGKLIFVDAYTSWCGPCKKMTMQTFPDKSLGDFFNENFINVKLDMEKGEGTSFASKYGVFSYPTLLFIDGNGKIVQREIGFKTPDILLNIGKKVVNAATDTKAFDDKYESKDYDVKFLAEYAKVLMKNKKPYNHIVDEYLMKQNDKNSREYFDFIYEFTNNYDTRIFNIFVENKARIIEYQGETNFKKKLMDACSKFAYDAGAANTPAILKQADAVVKQNAPESFKSYSLLCKANYALGQKKHKDYASNITKYAKKYHWTNKQELQAILKQLLALPKDADTDKKIELIQTQLKTL